MMGVTLENFSAGVMIGIYANVAAFATPTITKAAYTALFNDYVAKRKTRDAGGKADNMAYKVSRTALITALNTLADYVNSIAQGAIDCIKLAGYQASNDPSRLVPDKDPIAQEGVTLYREKKTVGQLTSDCGKLANGSHSLAILCEANPLPEGTTLVNGILVFPTAITFKISLDLNMQKKRVWTGLTAGVVYYCYYIVINSHGASGLSNEAQTKA